MTATIQKWGNSLALRIPLAVAKQIRVREGDAVTLRVSAAGLTVKSAPKRLNLDDLLANVTAKNRHPPTEWGADVGRELLPPRERNHHRSPSWVPSAGSFLTLRQAVSKRDAARPSCSATHATTRKRG